MIVESKMNSEDVFGPTPTYGGIIDENDPFK